MLGTGDVAVAQAPLRTRDLSIAHVRYDSTGPRTAATLTEGIRVERPAATAAAEGLLSLFADGRWVAQGTVTGSRFSRPAPAFDWVRGTFPSMRGELAFSMGSTAQQGAMPTIQVQAEGRAHLLGGDYGTWAGAGVSRTLRVSGWVWTLLSDFGGWVRRDRSVFTFDLEPKRATFSDPSSVVRSDRFYDATGEGDWYLGRLLVSGSAGVRLLQVNGTRGWGNVSISYPVRGTLLTISGGSYPPDILQGLEGARYFAMGVRLPTRLSTARHPRERPVPVVTTTGIVLPPAPSGSSGTPQTADGPPKPGDEHSGDGQAPYTGPALTVLIPASAPEPGMRVLRVDAPAAREVEVMGDFSAWEPVRLLATTPGVWQLMLPISPGAHRINLRIDGGAWDVPANLARVTDEFNGVVGLLIVR